MIHNSTGQGFDPSDSFKSAPEQNLHLPPTVGDQALNTDWRPPQISTHFALEKEPDNKEKETTEPNTGPTPKTSTENTAQRKSLLQTLKDAYAQNWGVALYSVASCAISSPAAWIICSSVQGDLASPKWNPLVGIVVSSSLYYLTFLGLSLYKSREMFKGQTVVDGCKLIAHKAVDCLKVVAPKEILENPLRYAAHFGLMHLGAGPFLGSLGAQLGAGLIGHLSTPLFTHLFVNPSFAIRSKAKEH